jgi:hypothetical protein
MLNWIKLISPGAIPGGWRVVLTLVLACGASAAPAPDEAELIRLTREFERALEGAGDAAALGRLLHPDYKERRTGWRAGSVLGVARATN